MQLTWTWNLTLSSLHAAERLSAANASATSSALNPRFVPLSPLARTIDAHAERLSLERARFWHLLLELAPQQEGVTQLVTRVLSGVGRDASQDLGLSADIRQFTAAYQDIVPDFAEQMRLRTQPLQQQWEARGPGLLRFIERFTEPELLVEAARVFLVQPVVAGFGAPHPRQNAVRFEAVLTEECPHLPEPLRLAWLLAQLDVERTASGQAVTSQPVDSPGLRLLGGLAMLPPALRAAQELDICDYTTSSVQLAIQRWCLVSSLQTTQALGEATMAWWKTYQTAKPDWQTALTGLAGMLEEVARTGKK